MYPESSTTANRVTFSPKGLAVPGFREVSYGQAAMGGQGDPGHDLHRQEDRTGEDAKPDPDLPGQRGTAGRVQPPSQDWQHQQAQQQLAADPEHGRQDADEPHEHPDADDAPPPLLHDGLHPATAILAGGPPTIREWG